MSISKVGNYAYSAVMFVPKTICKTAVSLVSKVSSAVASGFSKIASLFSRSSKPLVNVDPTPVAPVAQVSSAVSSVLPTVAPESVEPETQAAPTLSKRDAAIASLSPEEKRKFDNLGVSTRNITIEQRQDAFLTKLGKDI